MNIINITPPPTRPAAELIAEELLAGMNAEMARRVENHAAGFHRFWDSPETPDTIADALGDYGKLFLDSSRENLRNIGTIAAQVGKTLNDAIAPEHYNPRREIILVGNRITLAPPADGYDAWGRLIPVPVVEPEPVEPQ